MKFLAVVTPPTAIYHGWSTLEEFMGREFHTDENENLWKAQC